MNRITQNLKSLASRNEKALACFITAGFPTLDATIPFVQAIEKGGADIIELGMPFSDPLAELARNSTEFSNCIESGNNSRCYSFTGKDNSPTFEYPDCSYGLFKSDPLLWREKILDFGFTGRSGWFSIAGAYIRRGGQI